MRELEDAALTKHGIALSILMESAGKAVANEAMGLVKNGAPIAVFCGYGNNGGDGMVAARYLLKSGYQVKTFLVGGSKSFSPQTQENYDALIKLNHKSEEIATIKAIEKAFISSLKPALIIDAIFGIGIHRPEGRGLPSVRQSHGMLSDFYLKLIDKINAIASPVISVDIPSGLEADSGESLGIAVQADKTVTFGYLKAGFKNPKAKVYLGELIIADIGLPEID